MELECFADVVFAAIDIIKNLTGIEETPIRIIIDGKLIGEIK